MAKREKPTPINREKFLKNLPDPYQIPEQIEQPYDNSNPNAKYTTPGEPNLIRGNEISMKDDINNIINITLEDHDDTILYYLKNYIKPTVEINGNQREVPIIYGSPERWKSMQKDGFFRDKDGKAFIPVIAIKRESFEKDRRLGNKLDGNKVQNVQYFKTGYSKRNAYDNFSVLQNQKPSEEYQVGIIPDYITLTYKLTIFTDYVEHMNSIIEAIEFASDSYWGDKERFQFRASITQFPTPIQVENGNDRGIKSELTLVVNGYIIPKSVNVQKAAPSPKSYNVTKLLFKEFAQSPLPISTDNGGNKVITYTNQNNNRVAYYGTFNGTFIGDGSLLTNLPLPSGSNIDTGSFILTGSYNQDSSSFDNRINNFNFDTSSLLLTSSFNNFTSSYNTGSFTGSFIGDGSQLTGISQSLLQTITSPVDSYYGIRLQPKTTNSGFFISSSLNNNTGYFIRNSNTTGNGTISAFTAQGSGAPFTNSTQLAFFGDNYFVTKFRTNAALYSTNNLYIVSGKNNSSTIFTLGNTSTPSLSNTDDILILSSSREITAPGLTISIIDNETTGKSLVTKEWVNSNTPNFQQVTDVGSATTNNITITGVSESTTIQPANFSLLGENYYSTFSTTDFVLGDLSSATETIIKATPRSQNTTFNFEDEGGTKSVATREWVNDKNNLQWLVKNTTPTTTVTGTTSRTQIGSSILIPANTFSAEDLMNLDSFAVEKSAGLGTCQIRLWHNTSDTLTGATVIAVFAMANANVSAKIIRTFEITGGLLNGRVDGNVNAISDIGGLSVATLSIPFDPTIDNYFFTTVQLGNASDSVTRKQLLISK
jgi:hypothetical protein